MNQSIGDKFAAKAGEGVQETVRVGEALRKYTIERIPPTEAGAKTLEKEWFPLLQEIFPDPGDQEPVSLLKQRLKLKDENFFALLRNDEGKAVGIRLMQTDGTIIYTPWGGVVQSERNSGVYPMMVTQTLKEMKKTGASVAVHECEDPARIHNLMASLGVNMDPQGPQANSQLTREIRRTRAECKGRINFFRREMGSSFVEDPNLQYIRPSSDNPRKTQAYDLMALTAVDPNSPFMQKHFNADKTAISKEGYREIYLRMNLVQYPYPGETLEEKAANMRKALPPIDKHLKQIEAYPGNWISLKQGAVAPRSAPRKFGAEVDGTLDYTPS